MAADDIDAARREVCHVGRSLSDRGPAQATAGDIGLRPAPGDGFPITPADACPGFLEPDRIAQVAEDGIRRPGDRAGRTLALHRRSHDAEPAARCVVRTPGIRLAALGSAGARSAGANLGRHRPPPSGRIDTDGRSRPHRRPRLQEIRPCPASLPTCR